MKDLQKYTDGNMTPEELDDFSGKFLKAKFDHDRKKRWSKALKNKHDVERLATTQKGKGGVRRLYFLLPIMAAAAIALLVVFNPGIFSLESNTPGQLAEAYMEDSFLASQEITKGTEDIEQAKLKAHTFYNNKKFSEAIQQFEILPDSVQSDKVTQFFLGMSYLYNEEYADAVSSFEQAQTIANDSRFEQELQWYLSIAYIKAGDRIKAEILLQKIIDKQGWNHVKAKELMEAYK